MKKYEFTGDNRHVKVYRLAIWFAKEHIVIPEEMPDDQTFTPD